MEKKENELINSIDNIRRIMKELSGSDCDKNKCPIYSICDENYNMGGYGLCDIFEYMVDELNSKKVNEE